MNAPVPLDPETGLQKERRLFRELFGRLLSAVLNRIFDLQPKAAVQRAQYLTFLFFLTIFILSLTHEPYGFREWSVKLQGLFLFLFTSNPANGLNDFVQFVFDSFTDPRTLQYLPIFLAPFFIALQSAAIYLADIFELDNISIARKFITEVSLTGSNETIRISHGEIANAHRESPAFLIGGPGKVVVDLDSAALFEEPDGTPHVIGPTGREPGGKATLDGFERFRQAIDIRDHYVDLRDQDPRSQSVRSRSRDGMPVVATDVRLMFSVYRGENPTKTSQFPYPFSPAAVEQIVYKAPSRVTPDQVQPSAFEFSWINNMIGLIRGRLGAFMSERKLSDYLASIGMPEFERAKQSEERIAEQMRKLTQQSDESLNQKEIKPPPDFTPRYKITSLFSEFAEEFTRKSRNSGVELHWIGVGTWKTPVQVVPEKHLEAWQLSQENIKKSSDEAMKKVEAAAILEKLEALIRSVPLGTYEEINGNGKQMKRRSKRDFGKLDLLKDKPGKTTDLTLADPGLNTESAEDFINSIMLIRAVQDRKSSFSSDYYELDHDSAMKMLLLEYRKQLVEAVEFMKARNETVPPKIEEAIRHINQQSGWQHWAGT